MPVAATPGVYVQEIQQLPPAVAEVETAVPAFIGYTEKPDAGGRGQPVVVRSMLEFEQHFGGAQTTVATSITFDASWKVTAATFNTSYQLHESLRLFFANGGQRCYVVSAGAFHDDGSIEAAGLLAGLAVAAAVDEVTLLVEPDAVGLDRVSRAEVQRVMLQQAGERRDRFAILDVGESSDWQTDVSGFRADIGTDSLAFGAAYVPWVKTTFLREVRYPGIGVQLKGFREVQSKKVQSLFDGLDRAVATGNAAAVDRLERQLRAACPAYRRVVDGLRLIPRFVPPSGLVAGVYCRVDRESGVWKAPANVELERVSGLSAAITEEQQNSLNLDPATGKSVNAIREIAGRGIRIWGSRTLAGNDGEWRYVSVRRFACALEESIEKSCQWAVFEPNNEPLWARVRAMIESYLTEKWRNGALQGQRPQDAFFVRVGRGTTMTDLDIEEGRLVIEVGFAPVRPAEFIVIRIALKMDGS